MNEVVKVQVIHSPSGEAMVVLPLAQYESLLAATGLDEDALDIAIYDARKSEMDGHADASLPAEVSLALLRGASRLSALRKWRRMAQKELAQRAGIAQGYLSDIERGRRAGSAETIAQLASALDVPQKWLA